ncbi:MAG: cytochrome b/b6 domain-containing protein [Actinomycetes bacterium]
MPLPPESSGASANPSVPDTHRDRGARILRFDLPERWIHHSFALLMGVCVVTAAMLYIPQISLLVGQRFWVRTVHVGAGLLLLVPLVLGLVVSSGFRADVRRLSRFSPFDWDWLRPSKRRERLRGLHVSGQLPLTEPYPVGKFNAGQKLNASFTLGATLVMLATGIVLASSQLWPDQTRTGSTFVHDWVALVVVVVAVGHLWRALRDRQALAGMRTGEVTVDWAVEHHPLWAREVTRNRAGPGDEPPMSDPPSIL